MPIQLEHPIKALSEQEFHDLDFQVMRLAFDIQNELGRFYDEKIYQKELLADWGAFLNTALYKEAICYFFGGQENITQPVRITTGGTELGTQKIPLLSQTETFCISSLKNGIRAYRKHLQQFLDHTNLDTLYWINLNGSKIQFLPVSNPNHSVHNYSDPS